MFTLNAYTPRRSNVHLILGNTVNFLLDELMSDIKTEFKELLPQIFTRQPLEFALLDDHAVKSLLQQARRHFDTLKAVIAGTFPRLAIDPSLSSLEPSFYSRMYGIQGRLDVYGGSSTSDRSIVELKSGKPFNANKHGLSRNHYVQTLLYDLLIRSVYGHQLNIANYILYSGQITDPLRFAPPVGSLQRDAIRLRNEIVIAELQTLKSGRKATIEQITSARFPEARGYLDGKIREFERVMNEQSELLRKYISVFIQLIGLEQFRAKLGEHNEQDRNGLASMWLDARSQKEDRFEILSCLRIESADAASAQVRLSRTSDTNALANFRVGDIAVLYPDDVKDEKQKGWCHQCFGTRYSNARLSS